MWLVLLVRPEFRARAVRRSVGDASLLRPARRRREFTGWPDGLMCPKASNSAERSQGLKVWNSWHYIWDIYGLWGDNAESYSSAHLLGSGQTFPGSPHHPSVAGPRICSSPPSVVRSSARVRALGEAVDSKSRRSSAFLGFSETTGGGCSSILDVGCRYVRGGTVWKRDAVRTCCERNV